jgi:hypothetical protein
MMTETLVQLGTLMFLTLRVVGPVREIGASPQ